VDLVEIRKKAKKLKESKGKGKRDAEARAEETPEESTLQEDLGNEPITPSTTEVLQGEAEKILSAEEGLSEETDISTEGDETDVTLLPEEAGAEDFLTGVLDALYQEEVEAEDEEEDDIIELLCFKLSDEEYAVDIHNVKEIIKMMDITEVPKIPDFMLGIISLRGVIIPLLDLRMRLSLEVSEYSHKTRIIVASSGDMKMGMVVDAVTEVVRLKKGIMEAPPSMLTSIDADLLKGVGRHDDRLLIIPNLAKVLDVKI